jgi:uncharacterized membrane protein
MLNGRWKLKADKAFLALGIVFGLLFLFITPPMKVHDEWNHFIRAFKMSDGQIIAVRHGGGLPGGFIPAEVWLTVTCLTFDAPYDPAVGFNVPAARDKADYNPFLEERKNNRTRTIFSLLRVKPSEAEKKNEVFVTFPNTAFYFPLAYLPQTLGIATGRLLGLPPVVWIYLGRLFNLIAWLLLTYMAVMTTPVQKWGFVLLGLTPMTLFLASSLSADAMTIALAFLLIAVLLRHAFDRNRRISVGDKVLVVFLSVAISLSKFYLVLPLLLLLVHHKFRSKIRFGFFLAMVFSLIALSAASWAYAVKDLYSQAYPGVKEDIMRYVIDNPLQFIFTIVREQLSQIGMYLRQLVGHLGHYGSLYVPTSLVLLHGTVIALASLAERDINIRINLKQKVVIAAVFFGSILFILVIQHIAASYILGSLVSLGARAMQGRYLIPVAPLFLVLLYNRRVELGQYGKWLGVAVVGHLALILSVTLYIILDAYYS